MACLAQGQSNSNEREDSPPGVPCLWLCMAIWIYRVVVVTLLARHDLPVERHGVLLHFFERDREGLPCPGEISVV